MADGNNISAALFYKDIDTPIELIEIPTATEGSKQLLSANGETGELYGVEVEFLHDLGFLGDIGYDFYVSGNFTVSDSEVTLGLGDPNGLFLKQLSAALPGNPDPGSITNAATNNVRRLVGHSEWVANLQLGYDSPNGEHSASLVYNVFGDRIIIPGANGFNDGTEEPFHSLDLVYTYYPTFNTTVRLRARNILNEEKQIVQEGVTILSEDVGTNIDIRFSWDF
jgi:outer membrane receptor protein involved in Fe transport